MEKGDAIALCSRVVILSVECEVDAALCDLPLAQGEPEVLQR